MHRGAPPRVGMVSAGAALKGCGLIAITCYQFFGVSILCDEYLCPALDRLCARLKLPPSVAGATLLALVSSAPELIISTTGVWTDQTALSVPTILTSGLIAFCAIPPVVVVLAGPIKLRLAGMLRDAIFYAIGLALVVDFNQAGRRMGVREDLLLIGVYVVYLGAIRPQLSAPVVPWSPCPRSLIAATEGVPTSGPDLPPSCDTDFSHVATWSSSPAVATCRIA